MQIAPNSESKLSNLFNVYQTR